MQTASKGISIIVGCVTTFNLVNAIILIGTEIIRFVNLKFIEEV